VEEEGTQQAADVATGSSDGGGGAAEVKRMKLDMDAAGLLADDVTGTDFAEASVDACLAQLVQKQEPELDDSASHSQRRSLTYVGA